MGTYTLASSRPRSLTGVPDLGETKLPSEISSRPTIRPGHHEPFLRRTQTKAPTDASMALVLMLLILQLGSPELLPISETPTQSFQTQKQNKKIKEKSLVNQSKASILKRTQVPEPATKVGFMEKCL